MMKMIFVLAASFVAASCDQGGVVDQTVRQGVRQNAVQACAAWVPQSDIAAAAGLTGERLCSCAVDRLLEGKNLSDLPELRPDSTESRAAIAQCLADVPTNPRPHEGS
jgi:hypothetical protein